MMRPHRIFELEQVGDVLIVMPRGDLGSLEDQEIGVELKSTLDLLQRSSIDKVVIDFSASKFFGSTMLGAMIKLWKRISASHGRMTLCGLSDHEREVLKVTKLDGVWPQLATREAAIIAVRQGV
jgi:anti-anti-sigma factor